MSKLCIISLDACSNQDFQFLKSLPNFTSILEHSCVVEDVESIFVSNTYPIHTSIITGVEPAIHQILDNAKIQPWKNHAEWHWNYKDVKATSLFLEAKRAKKRTTNLFWPVTCYLPIQENLPEYIALSGENQIFELLKRGTPIFLIKNYLKYKHLVNGTNQPALDTFTCAIAQDILRKGKSDLVTIHFTDVDTQKHNYGSASKESKDALLRMDERLGKLLGAANGMYQFVIFSDHSQLDVGLTIDLNQKLIEYHLEDTYWFHQVSGSAFLIQRKEPSVESKERMELFLREESSIERALTQEELTTSGFSKVAICGVSAKTGIEFNHELNAHIGNHGYPLTKQEYTVFYLLYSPKVKHQQFIGGSLYDLTTICATLLDIPIWKTKNDLRIELFRNEDY